MKRLSIIICIGLLALSLSSFAKDVPDAIGIWTFDSVKGDQVLDISGQGQHGTILAGGEITKGKIGNGIKLNGSNQCVEVPHSDVLTVADDQLTMMCWFNWGAAGDGWQTFFSKGPMSGTNENWALFINTGAGYFHFITTPNGARINVDSPGGVVKKNEWQFVAGTYDGKMIRIYLDGEKIKEQALSGKLTPNKNNLRLGHREGSSHWWTGMLDEMAAFHRALDEKEIEQIRKEGFQKFMAVEAETKLPTVWGRIKSR
ncbi:TPA: LamG domain-containing protein [bacterium]|nr:LamG domain-containing protein [bacterium]